ncbi:unnamed protein product [Caenorhabditis nigoni]
MNLSIFPYVVQKEILDEMNISNLFLLSFVSKSTKKLIESSQAKRFKSINHIVYADSFTGLTNSREVYIPCMPKSDYIMELFERREETENDCFQLHVAGKIINFRLSDQNLPGAYFHPNDEESAIESIHKYFLDFFGDTVEHQWYQWISYDRDFIPHLPKLSLCLTFFPQSYRTIDVESLEKFFDLSPVLKRMNLLLYTSDLFRPESKFYQSESVYVKLYSKNVPTFLRHFQGRQAFLRCSNFTILKLKEFMNRWRSGEVCQKLEYLNIRFDLDGTLQNEFLNANGVKRIDATKKLPTHTLPREFQQPHCMNPDPITSSTYIVRETDYRVASILVQQDRFSFGVWKETEQEFLRMVE